MVCTSNTTFSLIGETAGLTLRWECSTNVLVEVGDDDNPTYVVKAKYSSTSGAGWVKVTITNGFAEDRIIQKDVWVGGPKINGISGPMSTPNNEWATYYAQLQSSASAPTDYSWNLNPINGNSVYDYGISCDIAFYNSGSYQLVVQACNACGWGPYYVGGLYVYDSYYMMMSPNPSSGVTTVSIESTTEEPDLKSASTTSGIGDDAEWDLEVYDAMQNLKQKKTKLRGNSTTINTQSWKEGVYMVRAKYKDKVLTGKLVVKQ